MDFVPGVTFVAANVQRGFLGSIIALEADANLPSVLPQFFDLFDCLDDQQRGHQPTSCREAQVAFAGEVTGDLGRRHMTTSNMDTASRPHTQASYYDRPQPQLLCRKGWPHHVNPTSRASFTL